MSSTAEVFFATQGETYNIARDGKFIWAPRFNKNGGAAMTYWETLTHTKPGDIIIHYARGHFRAISQVQPKTVDGKIQSWDYAPRPKELPGYGQPPGWIVKCEYTEFATPMPLKMFQEPILKYRRDVGGPFNKFARVNQGYLYHLETGIARAVMEKALELQPDLKQLDYMMEYLKGVSE